MSLSFRTVYFTALFYQISVLFSISNDTSIMGFYNQINIIKHDRCMPEGNGPLHLRYWVNNLENRYESMVSTDSISVMTITRGSAN